MPAQLRVWLKYEEHVPPILNTACEKNKPQTIGLGKGGIWGLTMENEELLPKQSVLGNELAFTAREIYRS